MIFMSDPAARTREMLGVTIVKILAFHCWVSRLARKRLANTTIDRQTDRQRMYIVTRRKRCYHKHRRRTAWLENRDINLNRISWVHVGRQYVPYFKGRSYHMNWNQRTYVSELSWPELRWRGFPCNYRILRFIENDKYDLNVHFQLIDSNEDRCLT